MPPRTAARRLDSTEGDHSGLERRESVSAHDAFQAGRFARRGLSWVLPRPLRRPAALLGLLVIWGLLVSAAFAEHLAPYSPIDLDYEAVLQPPSRSHLLGTDDLGRDVLSRILYGSRISLQVGVVAVGIAVILGTLLGLVAAFFGGLVDTAIMRLMDVMLAFPGVLLAIAIVAILGPDLHNTIIAVGISNIPVFARTARAAALEVLAHEYVLAARALGASQIRILIRYVLPNSAAPVIVLATVGIGTAILSAAGLSYVGLGAQPPQPEWGAMLSDARAYLRSAWWMATFPGLAIMSVVLSFNLVGDALRDLWDPRTRGR